MSLKNVTYLQTICKQKMIKILRTALHKLFMHEPSLQCNHLRLEMAAVPRNIMEKFRASSEEYRVYLKLERRIPKVRST